MTRNLFGVRQHQISTCQHVLWVSPFFNAQSLTDWRHENCSVGFVTSPVSERPNQGPAMLVQARSRHQQREVGYAAVMLKEGWSVAWRRENLVVVPPVLSRAAS